MQKKIIFVAGARPNFMKIAPLIKEARRYPRLCRYRLVHTGQHYDFHMSEIFFKDLNIPEPDIHLNIGSGSHAAQTAGIMVGFEKVLLQERPDIVVVVGDVNSTVACSLVAAKLNIKIAHVEAGLRSFDWTMPEEINRKLTDALSDYLFVSEESGLKNLKKEGVPQEKIFFVGNVMIDSLMANMQKIKKSKIIERLFREKGQASTHVPLYAVLTLHRPSNVDSDKALSEIYEILENVARLVHIVYPIHPRTKKMIKKHGYFDRFKSIKNFMMIEPLGYVDFIRLVSSSRFVLTDSGGIQEETTVLGIPCLTMRTNTERPVTIQKGTNHLVGRNALKIMSQVKTILNGRTMHSSIPQLWDGKAAVRIVDALLCINRK